MLVQLGQVLWWSSPEQQDMLYPMQTSVLPLARLATSPKPGCRIDCSAPCLLP